MSVVSVDLATRRWKDIGIAVLRGTTTDARVELVDPWRVDGVPDVGSVARVCIDLARRTRADLILIDGPQAWRGASSRVRDMRVCERCTRTPGKTGLPGRVKPASWTRMACFSVALFDALDAAGWPRFAAEPSLRRAAVETFPTHAWRTLGFDCLPAKARREIPLARWAAFLSERHGVRWPRRPSHDELQAVAAGLGGLALEGGGVAACDLHGRMPFREGSCWREGFIVSPRTAGAEAAAGRCRCGGGSP